MVNPARLKILKQMNLSYELEGPIQNAIDLLKELQEAHYDCQLSFEDVSYPGEESRMGLVLEYFVHETDEEMARRIKKG